MITLMKPETTLYYVRKQVGLSHFSHVPHDFCFLFKGHALDPSVEDKLRAMKIAVHNEVRVDPSAGSARLRMRSCMRSHNGAWHAQSPPAPAPVAVGSAHDFHRQHPLSDGLRRDDQ